MLKLEDAVRYPGAARKTFPITVIGLVLLLVFYAFSRSLWGSVLLGLLGWIVGALLTVGRDNRVLDLAMRIFDDHPEYTAEEAANAARRELGLRAVRYLR